MKTMTAKPAGMALNGLSEPRGRRPLATAAPPPRQCQPPPNQGHCQHQQPQQNHRLHEQWTAGITRQLIGSGSASTARQVSHSSSAGSLDSEGSKTPVFRAFLTPPPRQTPFPFPSRPDTASTKSEPEPGSLHVETGSESAPRSSQSEPEPPRGQRHRVSRQQTDRKCPCHDTEASMPYQETPPKQPLRSEGSGRFLYPDPVPPGSQASQAESSKSSDKPNFPYPGSDPGAAASEPRLSAQAGSGPSSRVDEPRFPYPGSEPDFQYAETPPKFVYQETDPKRAARHAAGSRRFSEETAARPRAWLREAGRSQSEDIRRLSGTLPEDACLDSDEAGGLSVHSDMRGLQAHVQGSSEVHVGTRVWNQNSYHAERVDSHVDNMVHHEHVAKKEEIVNFKHEQVENKTEVHNKTKNINIEHIEHKHEHIQLHTTEIVNSRGGPIYAEHLVVACDCKPSGDRRADNKTQVEPQRPFHECYRFLATRYMSFTVLSSPLPWYDGMVLDISKSCIDFSMASMDHKSSSRSYSSIEELVRDHQQQGKALRIIVEGHAGFGKTTLAARLALDWANGADYLKQYSHAFLIHLRELRGSLDEHIKTLHYPQERQDADAFLDYIKTNPERVLFIFDGYDELPMERRDAIDNIMSGLTFMHSGAVLTSRPTAMAMSFKRFCQSVSLTGFDASKQAAFVRMVYSDRPQMRIDHFLAVLERDRSVAELAQCPLMCLLLCEMHQRGKVGTGATKSQVYEELFHYLVGKAVHRRHPQPLAGDSARLAAAYEQALASFGAFCLQCLASDQLTFRESEIPTSCNTELLFEIGFIVKCRNFSSKMCSETFYEPIHKTFLEFLAAQHLRSISGEEETLKRALARLRQGTSRASEGLILHYLCGLLKTEAWTIMDHLDVDVEEFGRDFLFSLLREAGESPENVGAVCRRLPQDHVIVSGSYNHLSVWALCLSSPASEVDELEFVWDVGGDCAGDELDELVARQLGFWSALQSCANITNLRITFLYGFSSAVPAAFVDALCECMKHCARLARLAVLHVKAISSDSGADAFLPVVASLAQHVRSCTSLHRLTMDMNLSSGMAKQLCAGLEHVPRLQTLRLLRLFCNADGYDALASLIRGHISIKSLEVSVALADGPTDLNNISVCKLFRIAKDRIKETPCELGSPEVPRKKPLCRATQRTGPDQELEYLRDVLAVNLKNDERRVRVSEGVWCLVDQAGSRGLYALPMCDQSSHNSGYHKLLKAVRSRGGRLEHLTISQLTPLTRIDFACLGETIRKSESLTHLTLVDVAKAAYLFPLFTALPNTKRLESIVLKSQQVQLNDFLFFVFCRCLERNSSLQELNIKQWKISLESASSMDHLRSLMKNTSLKRLVMSESRVSLGFRLEELAAAPCASLSSLDLSNCTVETSSGAVLRGASLLPLLQGLSALKQLDLSDDKTPPPLTDAAVKAFFAGLAGFKTLQELAIRGWRYDVSSPETAYAETKAAAKKCGRLTTVRIDNSQFTARSGECGKQWLVQALATGVPHLQHLSLAGLSAAEARRCALTSPHLDQLARAILKAKWTGRTLRLFMPQLDSRLVDAFVELTRTSSRIEVTSDGRTVVLKRSRLGASQWPWSLRSK